MGVWILMLISCVLIPVIMILSGVVFSKKAPKNINYWCGYRTWRAMLNRDTWEFAHKHSGRIFLISGCVLLPIAVISMMFFIGKSEDAISIAGLVVMMVELTVMLLSIIPTERALKKTFDDNGKRIKSDKKQKNSK